MSFTELFFISTICFGVDVIKGSTDIIAAICAHYHPFLSVACADFLSSASAVLGYVLAEGGNECVVYLISN